MWPSVYCQPTTKRGGGVERGCLAEKPKVILTNIYVDIF